MKNPRENGLSERNKDLVSLLLTDPVFQVHAFMQDSDDFYCIFGE